MNPTWVVVKEVDRMGVARLGLLTYDYKSTTLKGLQSRLRLSLKAALTNKSNPIRWCDFLLTSALAMED